MQKSVLTGGLAVAFAFIPVAGPLLALTVGALSTLNGHASFDEMRMAQTCIEPGWETLGQGCIEQQREFPNTVKTVYAEPNQDYLLNLVPGRPVFDKQI